MGCFPNLVRTVLLIDITAEYVAKAFGTHLALANGLPHVLLFDNDKHFISRFFQHVCKFLGFKNVLTTIHCPQANGQVDRYNCTIFTKLHYCVEQHSKDWLFENWTNSRSGTTLTFTGSRAVTSFELVLSKYPKVIIMKPDPEKIFGKTGGSYLHYRKLRLSHIVDSGSTHMLRDQRKY